MQSDFNAATKNRHMRRFAYASGVLMAVLVFDGMRTGVYAPPHVFYALTGVIGAWAGFSKLGEIADAKQAR